MCIPGLFGKSGDNGASQMLALAQSQQQQAAAAVANANLDTESSRTAAEQQLRKAAASQGFASTIFGGANAGPAAPTGFKQLFGA